MADLKQVQNRFNQKVLITGGVSDASTDYTTPPKGTFTATGSMSVARGGHTATLLPNGKVLIAGAGDFPNMLAPADLYQ